MLRYGGASIQVLDMPGLVPGAAKGRGRGREVLSVVRSLDLILFLIDKDHPDFQGLVTELENSGIRINTQPPRVVLTPSDRGGLTVSSTVKLTHVADGIAAQIVREFGIHNGSLIFRQDATADQLIDVLAGNRVYIPAILTVNKSDLLTRPEMEAIKNRVRPFQPLFISARAREGLPEVIEAIGKALAFIRVYLKPPGREPDLVEPVILRRGMRVEDLLRRLPTELGVQFKSAQVWGKSARFPGQTVGRDHPLADEDIVTVLIHRGSRAA
jgi:hypothetical protein